MAIRVQRKRTKGYHLPENTKCVDRTSKWGNPYKVVQEGHTWRVMDKEGNYYGENYATKEKAAGKAVELFRLWVDIEIKEGRLNLDELKGKNLACFCPLSSPCHADYLLQLAMG